jgi:NitT/TauT family transport system permease protein
MKDYFVLGEMLNKKNNMMVGLIGFGALLLIWSIICQFKWIPSSLLPSPWRVITSFNELHLKDALVLNAIYSIKLNLLGYFEAVIVSIIVGYLLGLFGIFRSLFSKYLEAFRFLPLPAMMGVFIAWFGIYDNMKIQFLAFGISVYLIPTVIQRISDVEKIYLQTIYTLGANKWQTIVEVYLPAVFVKLIDDIRVLVAISWTYIIVAELVNRTGGIGAMAYTAARQSRMDKVFAVLLVIIVIGFVQDMIFTYLDKKLFPHKYV